MLSTCTLQLRGLDDGERRGSPESSSALGRILLGVDVAGCEFNCCGNSRQANAEMIDVLGSPSQINAIVEFVRNSNIGLATDIHHTIKTFRHGETSI